MIKANQGKNGYTNSEILARYHDKITKKLTQIHQNETSAHLKTKLHAHAHEELKNQKFTILINPKEIFGEKTAIDELWSRIMVYKGTIVLHIFLVRISDAKGKFTLDHDMLHYECMKSYSSEGNRVVQDYMIKRNVLTVYNDAKQFKIAMQQGGRKFRTFLEQLDAEIEVDSRRPHSPPVYRLKGKIVKMRIDTLIIAEEHVTRVPEKPELFVRLGKSGFYFLRPDQIRDFWGYQSAKERGIHTGDLVAKTRTLYEKKQEHARRLRGLLVTSAFALELLLFLLFAFVPGVIQDLSGFLGWTALNVGVHLVGNWRYILPYKGSAGNLDKIIASDFYASAPQLEYQLAHLCAQMDVRYGYQVVEDYSPWLSAKGKAKLELYLEALKEGYHQNYFDEIEPEKDSPPKLGLKKGKKRAETKIGGKKDSKSSKTEEIEAAASQLPKKKQSHELEKSLQTSREEHTIAGEQTKSSSKKEKPQEKDEEISAIRIDSLTGKIECLNQEMRAVFSSFLDD